jgi:hypothetical protein
MNFHISQELKQERLLPIDAAWCILHPMAKTRMNIYLNREQKRKLETLSGKTGAPVAELVRRAIDAYLSLRKKELK